MEERFSNYNKVKKKYLKFLTSQEILSEPFRDKLGQLNKFYLPISKMIAEEYFKKKKNKVIGLTGGQGTGNSTISNLEVHFRFVILISEIDSSSSLSTPFFSKNLSLSKPQ